MSHEASDSHGRSVVIVAPVAPPIGGMTRWTSLVCRELTRQGVEFAVVNTSPRVRGVDGRGLLDRFGKSALRLPRYALSLFRATRGGGATVHIASSGGPAHVRDVALLIVARLMHVPAHLHLHHGRVSVVLKMKSCERVLLECAARLATSIILLDEAGGHAASEAWPSKAVRVIPNLIAPGVEDDGSKHHQIAYIGWVIQEKGIEVLLEAWELLAKRFPSWKLALVGPGRGEYLSRLTTRYSFEGIVIHGELNHAAAMRVLHESSILVLPSYTEGFPNVVLEGMANSRPVVASSVGALPEIMAEGGGCLVDPGDPHDLVRALTSYMSSEAKRREDGRKGRARVQGAYDVAKVVAQYRKVWEC